MIRRMVVMLLACTLVFGGFFGFQAFKANIIKKVLASLANPPQTVATTTAAVQSLLRSLHSIVGGLVVSPEGGAAPYPTLIAMRGESRISCLAGQRSTGHVTHGPAQRCSIDPVRDHHRQTDLRDFHILEKGFVR